MKEPRGTNTHGGYKQGGMKEPKGWYKQVCYESQIIIYEVQK